MPHQFYLKLPSYSKGIHLITSRITEELKELPETGILHVFIQHTSAGLTLNENADPDVRFDLQQSLNLLVPENAPHYTHTMEGPDDMPAHIKTILVGNSISIPIAKGRLALGTWQGIFLCEFRNHAGPRTLVVTVLP